MRKNVTYRKWQSIRGDQHFIMIHPKGVCIQISFEKETSGEHIKIFQTPFGVDFDESTISKFQRCLRYEWEVARRKAKMFLDGDMIHLALIEHKKNEHAKIHSNPTVVS